MSWFRRHTGKWFQTPALKSADFITKKKRERRDGERFGQNCWMQAATVDGFLQGNKEQVYEHLPWTCFLVAIGLEILVLNGQHFKNFYISNAIYFFFFYHFNLIVIVWKWPVFFFFGCHCFKGVITWKFESFLALFQLFFDCLQTFEQ